jgi:FKBP-type peptidyl-prolyl cis-trans isomerase
VAWSITVRDWDWRARVIVLADNDCVVCQMPKTLWTPLTPTQLNSPLNSFDALSTTEMKEGTGASPTLTSTVEVHYHGTLTDGTVFDSSVDRGQTISLPLNGVIKGWQEGVAMMKEGGKATLVVPSDLAYGDQGSGEVIPPGATLKFEVELFKVE